VTTLLPAAGGLPALRAARASAYPGMPAGACLGLQPQCTVAASSRAGAGIGAFAVEAHCAPRRITVLAILRRRSDRLAVVTPTGRRIAARYVAIPAAIDARRLTAALVVVPAREGIGRIVLHARKGRSVRAGLPPAAHQCGYSTVAATDGGFITFG
jgi:hypothetical protein